MALAYQSPLQGPFLGLLALSDALDDNIVLLQDSRWRLEQLLEVVQDAVHGVCSGYVFVSETA